MLDRIAIGVEDREGVLQGGDRPVFVCKTVFAGDLAVRRTFVLLEHRPEIAFGSAVGGGTRLLQQSDCQVSIAWPVSHEIRTCQIALQLRPARGKALPGMGGGGAFETLDRVIERLAPIAANQSEMRPAQAVAALAPMKRVGVDVPDGHRVLENVQRLFRVVLLVSIEAIEPCRAQRVVRQRPERRIGVLCVNRERVAVVLNRLFDVVGPFLFDALVVRSPKVVLHACPHVGIAVARPDAGRLAGMRNRPFDVLASPRTERFAKYVGDLIVTRGAFVGIGVVRLVIDPCREL